MLLGFYSHSESARFGLLRKSRQSFRATSDLATNRHGDAQIVNIFAATSSCLCVNIIPNPHRNWQHATSHASGTRTRRATGWDEKKRYHEAFCSCMQQLFFRRHETPVHSPTATGHNPVHPQSILKNFTGPPAERAETVWKQRLRRNVQHDYSQLFKRSEALEDSFWEVG